MEWDDYGVFRNLLAGVIACRKNGSISFRGK